MLGAERSGSGHTHESMSMAAPCSLISGMCDLQPPVQVVSGARAFGGDHGGAERVAGRALLAEGSAFVGFDQALQHLPGTADRRLRGVNSGDGEPMFGIELAV